MNVWNLINWSLLYIFFSNIYLVVSKNCKNKDYGIAVLFCVMLTLCKYSRYLWYIWKSAKHLLMPICQGFIFRLFRIYKWEFRWIPRRRIVYVRRSLYSAFQRYVWTVQYRQYSTYNLLLAKSVSNSIECVYFYPISFNKSCVGCLNSIQCILEGYFAFSSPRYFKSRKFSWTRHLTFSRHEIERSLLDCSKKNPKNRLIRS